MNDENLSVKFWKKTRKAKEPIMAVIEFDSTFSEADYVRFNTSLILRNWTYRIILFTLLPIGFLWGLYSLFVGEITNGTIAMAWSIGILYLLVFHRQLQIRKIYRRSEKMKHTVHYSISETEMKIKTMDLDEKWQWSEFSRFTTTKDFTFLFLRSNKSQAKVISHASIHDDSKREEVLRIFRENIGKGFRIQKT
jgi:hypothetical protein